MSNLIAVARFTVRFLAIGACVVFIIGCSRSKASTDPDSRPEASLVEVNQALESWLLYKGSYPTNLDELKSFPLFKKRLPTPPPGEKLVLERNGKAVFIQE